MHFMGSKFTENALAAPDPAGGVKALPQTPCRFRGREKGKEEKEGGWKGEKGYWGRERGREGKGRGEGGKGEGGGKGREGGVCVIGVRGDRRPSRITLSKVFCHVHRRLQIL